jgi:hypothetical protein
MPPSPPPSNALGAALQAMITDGSLTVSEAGQWCAGAIGHREAARLRQLAAQAHNNDEPENDSTMAADIPDGAHKYCRRTWSFGAVASTRRLCENARQSQAASWRAASSFPLVNYLPVARRARAQLVKHVALSRYATAISLNRRSSEAGPDHRLNGHSVVLAGCQE